MFEQMETWDFTTYALFLCVHYNGSLKKLQGSAFNNGMSAVRCSAQEWGVPSCWSWANNVENKSKQHNLKNNIASHGTWSITWKLVLWKQTIITRLINVLGYLQEVILNSEDVLLWQMPGRVLPQVPDIWWKPEGLGPVPAIPMTTLSFRF